MKKGHVLKGAYLGLVLILSGCDGAPPAADLAQAEASEHYVGAAACADCHTTETSLWQGSQHDQAMQVATLDSALGDFSGSSFSLNGVTSRFYSREQQLFIETEGADGELQEFPVRYTFGVYPLQQYLLELPNQKIQAFGVAWNSLPVAEGGQRWFHVYGDEQIGHTDVLHWTAGSQNWETMCADCHSTNLISQFDLETDSFTTSWSELNVACEACHGPGSKHVLWAQAGSKASDNGLEIALTERHSVAWVPDQISGTAQRSEKNLARPELNTCAGCHSRRSRIAEGNHPATEYLDLYMPALISDSLYHADGQILDEVYVYGSFLQSKMYQAGVTCSDCHEPHSLQLRAEGAAVCQQCHTAERFASREHQLHADGEVDCIDCHMPATTYMQVDVRNDHSFRKPRPELSIGTAIPNACNACHADKSPAWAAAILASARAENNAEPHWSPTLAGTADSNQQSMQALAQLTGDSAVPAIIRASAANRLQLGDSPPARAMLSELAADENPLLRLAAAQALQDSQASLVASIGPGLLADDVLAVRMEAARALAVVDPVLLPAGSNVSLQAALDEYIASQLVSSERSEAYVNIGNVQRLRNRLEQAEQSYTTAIEINPQFIPAYVNLADLYRSWGKEKEAEQALRSGLVAVSDQASLHHALGLSLVRQQRVRDALPELKLAAEAVDASSRYALVYAVALDSQAQTDAAVVFLAEALQRYPADMQLQKAYREFSAKLP